jgi:hypothetical protein
MIVALARKLIIALWRFVTKATNVLDGRFLASPGEWTLQIRTARRSDEIDPVHYSGNGEARKKAPQISAALPLGASREDPRP